MKVITKKEKGPVMAISKLTGFVTDAENYIVSKLEGCSAGCKGHTSY
jgi:hypothetical protein